MKLTREYFESREAAMTWLSAASPRRTYAEGLRILVRSGYKPNVASLLQRKGEQDWTMEKLAVCLRELIQVYYNPEDPRFDAAVGDVDDLNDRAGETVPVKSAGDVVALMGDKDRWWQMPEVVQMVTKSFADAFKQRAKMNRRRAAIGEGNDAESVAERKHLSEEMDALTAYMDALWPLRQAWDERREVPTREQIDEVKKSLAKPKVTTAATAAGGQSLEGVDTARLKVRRKSVVTQLTRKRNLLRYQQTTAAQEENPMPECPLRAKTERQIRELTDELTALDYELARR